MNVDESADQEGSSKRRLTEVDGVEGDGVEEENSNSAIEISKAIEEQKRRTIELWDSFCACNKDMDVVHVPKDVAAAVKAEL